MENIGKPLHNHWFILALENVEKMWRKCGEQENVESMR